MKNPFRTLLLFLTGILAGATVHAQKPNFIIILADDLGYGDVGFTGSSQIQTPHIDRLAGDGVIFTQGYVSAPVCGPSRAGLITGRNQVEFGVDNNLTQRLPQFNDDYHGLPVTEKTIADRLAALGYRNSIIGKWHLGEDEKFQPLQRGFHEFWGYLGGGHHYFKSEPNGEGYLCPIVCTYKEAQAITYLTDDKGDECVDFIRRHKEQPFFLFASFNAPHAPMHATKEDLKLFKHIKDKKRRAYCAMTHRLDVNVGRIINELKKHDLYENTLIAFLSDNGGPKSNGSLNAPLNGSKGILLEGGIRVPFAISWPQAIDAGQVYHHPVSSLDLTATFVELAGGKITTADKLDGVNLMPYILGENKGRPHPEMKWQFTISKSIRQGDWKLVQIPDRLPMLYNIKADISEQNNLAHLHGDKVATMLKELGDWSVGLPHPLFLEGANWKQEQLKLYDYPWRLEQF